MSGDKYRGLSKMEFAMLSRYNAEKSRGIKHTTQWKDQMATFQSRWNNYGHSL